MESITQEQWRAQHEEVRAIMQVLRSVGSERVPAAIMFHAEDCGGPEYGSLAAVYLCAIAFLVAAWFGLIRLAIFIGRMF